WKSRVENTVAADPFVGSNAIIERPALGGLFVEASAGGGDTHRYSGGGASPSRMGRRDAGPSEPLTTAPARYARHSAAPAMAARRRTLTARSGSRRSVRSRTAAATPPPAPRAEPIPRSRSSLGGWRRGPGTPVVRTRDRCRSGAHLSAPASGAPRRRPPQVSPV